MKILKFKAINYKGIKELEIIPKENLIIISGKNGAGKSSALDGIKNLFAGKDKIIKNPIKNGEDRAELEMELEGKDISGAIMKYKIKKVFTDKTETLLISNSEGMTSTSPQSFLNNLTGGISFDPNEFLNKPEKKQREDLIKFAGLDLEKIDNKMKDIYDERHQVGIEGKALAQYTEEEIKEAKEYKDIEELDVAKLTEEYNEVSKQKANYEVSQANIQSNKQRIEELKIQLDKLEENNKVLEEVKSAKDFDEKYNAMAEADEKNKAIRNAKQVLESNKKVIDKKTKWNELNLQYKEEEEGRQLKLIEMELPLEGLVITEDSIKFNDVPIKQLSMSEGLKIAIAMYVETCAKEKIELKVMTIKNGNDFDDDSIKIIAQIIDGYDDITVFMERVVNNEKEAVSIYIEDGEIINKEKMND